MAARDLSVIRTPPPNRQPIHTEIRVFDEDLIAEVIHSELDDGGQVYFVHNRVNDLTAIVDTLRRIVRMPRSLLPMAKWIRIIWKKCWSIL